MNQDNTSDTVVNSLSLELETLKGIYLEDFQTEDKDTQTIVSVNLSPSTADLKDKQYVCLTLQITICKAKYPQELPLFNVRNPRGLSEETVARILADLNKIAEEKKGTNMLYNLIDFVKESITSNNFPSDKCMICLYHFTKDDVFVVTKCFHHFHCYCLAHYIQKSKEESVEASGTANGEKSTDSQPCPVCREDQDFADLVKKDDYPPPSLSSKPIPGENVILEEARQKQESFAPMFEKQQQQGGIINEEEEKNKFLLRTSDSNATSPSSSTSESRQVSPVKLSESSKESVIPDNTNGLQDKAVDNAKSANGSTSNGHRIPEESKPEEKEDDDKNEEWSDAKPEISPEEVKGVKDESKVEPKLLSDLKTDPSKSESDPSKDNSNKEGTETNGKTESEAEVKDGKTEKDGNKDKVKRNKSSRRNSRRNRTRSSGRRASAGDGTNKTTNGEETSQNESRRNRSRRRNRTNSYDPNSYGADYRSQNYRPNNRGNSRMRGRGRGGVGYASNGGLPSPPYKRNFGNAYPEETNNHRSDNYNQDSYRDRPGFYAARVIRPSVQNNANYKARNGTRGSEDSSKASISPQADSSEVNQSTSEQEQQTRPRSRSKNKRRNRQNRNRTRSQNGHHSESDHQNVNIQQGNDYSNSNPNKLNNRHGYNNYEYNYRSQGPYGRNSYGGGYYNGNYPNYSYGYGASYNLGYGNGYNYNYYGRYNGNYGNYYRQRQNYNRAPQRNNNYRSSFKPRKRTDTGQSQSSVKSNKATESAPTRTDGTNGTNGTVVEVAA